MSGFRKLESNIKNMMSVKHLVLGGARSGKSRYAQRLAENAGREVVYIATASAGDAEMHARIERHKQQRPNHWKLVEESIYLADVLRQQDAANRIVLIDCLTLWLSNLLGKEDEALWMNECNKLFAVLPQLHCDLIMVSNEVGQGIVPANALARRFIDEAGWLHQRLAEICNRVTFMLAGIPQTLK
ncbi:MAG: adenosylcobinamide kinase / adenosylcobinamide-phosphate guanylyltransferase [Pseudomonadota bacterium]|nr:adenosylcobinamide kinase / adenosylcobinamide-phosphate guanylyltransferase [Pseudomonadota bacterium]